MSDMLVRNSAVESEDGQKLFSQKKLMKLVCVANNTIITMYNIKERHGAYKRGVLYFIVYSAILFIMTDAVFLNIKTLFYFLIGFALSGAVAVLFMFFQYRIEKEFSPNFWILNIVIDIAGYYVFTHALFYLTFSII